jgi:hypothetical protein
MRPVDPSMSVKRKVTLPLGRAFMGDRVCHYFPACATDAAP